MYDFTNKTVLVTGGSRGIGKSCVSLFAKANADVLFTYNQNNSSAKDLISSLSPAKVFSFQVDFNSIEDVEKKSAQIIAHSDKIDVLVNNAGIWKFGDADSLTVDDWEETLRINLTSAFIITKAVIPLMKRQKYGKIINISSTAGQRGEAFHSHYAASKGALISYTKSLASELGPFNINVNCIAPGWVLTDMSNDVLADTNNNNKIISEIPIRRIASAEDIAGPVLFLASESSRHITGEILNVNGGSVLCG